MLRDSGAELLVVDRAAKPALAELPVPLLTVDEGGDAAEDDWTGPRIYPENLVYILYTSGSTGKPKGVQVTHGSLANVLASVIKTVGLGPDDRVLAATPPTFDIATVELFAPLLVGGCVAIADERERREGAALAAALERSGCSVVQATPTGFRMLIEAGWRPCPIKLISGGEALTPELARRLLERGARLWNGYGPSETSVYSTFHEVRASDAPVPIGRALAATCARVLDEELGEAAAGEPGELFIAGAGVARGYLGRPGLTAERFLPDPLGPPGSRMYRTGDRVERLPDGTLAFGGRLDHQIKLRGHRIELGEVEAALREHPQVVDAALTAPLDGSGERRLVAYLTLRSGERHDLRGWLADRLPGYMVPAALVVLERLPTTSSGKIDRNALPLPPAARTATATPYREAGNKLEWSLAQIWEDVLGIQPVGADDDLLQLGGDSLSATRIVARVNAAYGVRLSLDAALSQSPAAMAAQVAARAAAAAEPAAVGPEAGLLSSAEHGLWFQEKLSPGTTAYLIPVSYRLRGPLDERALEAALYELGRRHDSMRTCFEEVAGRPVRVVKPEAAPALVRDDLSGLPPEESSAALMRLKQEEAETPFDLSRAPLWRARLVRCGQDQHVLILTFHHIVSDAWSLHVVTRELGSLYSALRARVTLALPPAPTYAAFAERQARRLADGSLEADLGYWRQHLAGMERLRLGADHRRPGWQTFDAGSTVQEVPRALVASLRQLGMPHGATLFMTLLAAFELLLHGLSGQQDVVIGTPVAGRSEAGVDDAVGLFVNLVVLRGRVTPEATFEQLVRGARETVVGALEHQSLPFERLVEALHPARDPRRNPLFQVLFNMYNFPDWALALDGLEAEPLTVPMAASLFDMTLYVHQKDAGLRFELVYNRQVFSEQRMAAVLCQYVFLLQQIAAAPALPCSDYLLRTPSAEAVLPGLSRPLDAWIPAPDPLLALSELDGRAGQREAVAGTDVSLTLAQLAASSGDLAQRLAGAGLRTRVVAVFGPRGPALVTAVLGVLRSGAVLLVLDNQHPPAKLAEELRLTGAAAVVATDPAHPVPAVLAAQAGTVLPLAAPPQAPRADPPPADLDRLAYVAFTSGSTGTPKAVAGTLRPPAHFIEWQLRRFGLTADDRFSMLSGLGHDPLLRDLLAPLACGGVICVPPADAMLDPSRLAGWLAAQRVTVLHATPVVAKLIGSAGQDLPDLRYAFIGGDMLMAADVDRLRQVASCVTVVNCYGTTETPQVAACHVAGQDGPDPVPIGRGIDGTELVLMRGGHPAGMGELAEVHVRSRFLSLGYLGDKDLTVARFQPNPLRSQDHGERLYRTGDQGRYLPDGSVQLEGRIDDQVKLRGHRVEPGEVQAHLRRLSGVRDADVVAVEQAGDCRLVAYVEPAVQPGPALLDVRRQLRAQLPEYMLPAALVLVDRLPRTPNGKLDRRALPAPQAAEPEPGFEPPTTPTEQAVARIWGDVLNLSRVGATHNFFDLGGSSLSLVRVQVALRHQLAAAVSVVDLFRFPDVRSLAAHLDGSDPARAAVERRISLRRQLIARRIAARQALAGHQ
jgi:amino acid adenylation domain-containing protein